MQAVADAMFDPFEYLVLRHKDGLLKTDFKQPLGKVSYHIPCHLRVQNIGQKTREVLKLVPGTDGQHGRALLGPRRHLRREDASSIATSMKIGKPVFKADGDGRARLRQLRLPDRRPPDRAGHRSRAERRRQAPQRASADAGAHRLRSE